MSLVIGVALIAWMAGVINGLVIAVLVAGHRKERDNKSKGCI